VSRLPESVIADAKALSDLAAKLANPADYDLTRSIAFVLYLKAYRACEKAREKEHVTTLLKVCTNG
jgi:hypothetical protein